MLQILEETCIYLKIQKKVFYNNSDLLSEIFSKYNIPKEYQKLIFKKRKDNNIQEIFTGISFNYENTKNGKLKARVYGQNKLTSLIYLINYDEAKCDKEETMNFYSKLYENGYLKTYLEAINNYFFLKMDLDYIFDSSKEKKSLKEIKRLHKAKALTKKIVNSKK